MKSIENKEIKNPKCKNCGSSRSKLIRFGNDDNSWFECVNTVKCFERKACFNCWKQIGAVELLRCDSCRGSFCEKCINGYDYVGKEESGLPKWNNPYAICNDCFKVENNENWKKVEHETYVDFRNVEKMINYEKEETKRREQIK